MVKPFLTVPPCPRIPDRNSLSLPQILFPDDAASSQAGLDTPLSFPLCHRTPLKYLRGGGVKVRKCKFFNDFPDDTSFW